MPKNTIVIVPKNVVLAVTERWECLSDQAGHSFSWHHKAEQNKAELALTEKSSQPHNADDNTKERLMAGKR
jgi:hypothetical protein